MIAAVWAACEPEPTSRLMSGSGRPSLPEEDLGHLLVVVLTGVDEQLLDAELVEGGDDRGSLWKVRACARDMNDGAIRHEAEDVTGSGRGPQPAPRSTCS